MRTRDIKTIDVITKTWFDKINGNTYFAQKIIINQHRKNETLIINHFQYGYSSFDYFAKKRVMKALNLKTDINNYSICGYGPDCKIKFNNIIIKDCKKKELINI